eukprot:7673799-Pyramimonas_sp.AAC.1
MHGKWTSERRQGVGSLLANIYSCAAPMRRRRVALSHARCAPSPSRRVFDAASAARRPRRKGARR